MKKIYNIAAALLISSTVMGQMVDPHYYPPFQAVDMEEAYQKALEQKKEQQLKRINSKDPLVNVRVSHSDERVANATTPLTGYTMPIFPDSLPLEQFSNTASFRGVQIHAIGGIFDPTSDDFVLINSAVSENDPYTVDTLWIIYNYQIVNPTSIDTLRVQMFLADTTTSDPGLNTLTIAAGFPNEGAPVKGIRFASTSAHGVQTSAVATGITTFDYILSDADTNATAQPYLPIPVNMNVPKGQLFCWFAFYIPGTTYNNTDVYFDANGGTETLNTFRSFGQQEDANADVLFAFDPSSYGSSHTLFNDARYQIATTAFLNTTVPPGLSSVNFSDYTYSAANSSVGVDEISNNAKLGNAYPNPFREVTRIKYSLTNTTNVQFEVTDITGKIVMQMNEGLKTAGVYNVDISAEKLHSGVYYYSIITDAEKVTRKMIVVE